MGAGSVLGSAGLWAAFALGLTGGFGHCLAMCGPFVAGVSLASGTGCAAEGGAGRAVGRGAVRYQVSYHAGRLLTYSVLGLLLGLLGEAGALVSLAGPFGPVRLTRFLKVGAGAATIALGVALLLGWLLGRDARLPEPTRLLAGTKWWRQATTSIASKGGAFAFPLGVLMGLLPCMPLLPVEVAALASGHPLSGLLVMLAFGLGTIPALAGFGLAFGLVGARARGWLAGATSIAVIALGAFTLLQDISVLVRR